MDMPRRPSTIRPIRQPIRQEGPWLAWLPLTKLTNAILPNGSLNDFDVTCIFALCSMVHFASQRVTPGDAVEMVQMFLGTLLFYTLVILAFAVPMRKSDVPWELERMLTSRVGTYRLIAG